MILDSYNRSKDKTAADSEKKLENLTTREKEIANLIAQGQSNLEIAANLEIAERTVKAHVSSIFQKLGLRDRLQLALLVRDAST